jgi:cysteinyl-tRNA synthetase
MEELGSILGILEPEHTNQERISELVNLLIELRTELRTRHEYELADKIRDRMEKIGLLVEDNASETRWIA